MTKTKKYKIEYTSIINTQIITKFNLITKKKYIYPLSKMYKYFSSRKTYLDVYYHIILIL